MNRGKSIGIRLDVWEGITISPIVMQVENHPKSTETTIGDPFSISMIMGGMVNVHRASCQDNNGTSVTSVSKAIGANRHAVG